LSTIKINTCDQNWFNRDYVFYNKKGNPINILFDEELGYYKGKLYFEENSSDTFKNLEISTFERIRGFDYQQYNSDTKTDELSTEKFQLFNTNGMSIIGNTSSIGVTKVEAVNDRKDFFSKWIYGQAINTIFRKGEEIKFSRDIFGINSKETYTVISTKTNAVMIITGTNNREFINQSGGVINDPNQYTNVTANGVNAIKIYDYIDSDYSNNFPNWSEPNFYNLIYSGQKLNLVNLENNDDTIVTINSKTLGDNYYTDFKLMMDDFDNNLKIRVTNKTNNILLYNGNINIVATGSYIGLSSSVNTLIKPNSKLTIPNSNNNVGTITVDSTQISTFNRINQYYFNGGLTPSDASKVLFNNQIYSCVTSYTQSATSSITPEDNDFWEETKYLPIVESINDETINGTLYLETNSVDLSYTYDNNINAISNINNAFTIHSDSINQLGLYSDIDPLGEFVRLRSLYPTNYVDVKFFVDKVDSFSGSITDGTNFSPTGYTFSYDPHPETNVSVTVNGTNVITTETLTSPTGYVFFSDDAASTATKFNELTNDSGLYWQEINANFGLTATDIVNVNYTTEVSSKERTIERIIEIEETLNNEDRDDYAERNEERIVFNDIDDFGISIRINNQVYVIESTIITRGNGSEDTEESIDITLKAFVEKWKLELDKRGIYVDSEYFGNNNVNVLHNSLYFRTAYPNVLMNINRIDVGANTDYSILDKYIIFYQLGGDNTQLSININNINYITGFDTDVETTLGNWIIQHTEVLNDNGIYVDREFNNLIINKKTNFVIDININVGRFFYEGEQVFEIINYSKGYEGLIISSNKVVQNNNNISFEDECFSTGQIVSINNTDWTLVNQEYNIIQLDPDRMVFSYQGAFWGTSNNSTQNAFFNLAFGEDFEIGDTILYIDSGSFSTASVTKVAKNFYQAADGNQVITIERENAFYYDESAISLTASFNPDDIKYLTLNSNLVDIDYLNSTFKNIALTDQVNLISSTFRVEDTISSIEAPIMQSMNPFNNLLYVLSDNFVYVIDPYLNQIKSTVSNLGIGWDMEVDYITGETYISFTDSDRIMIIDPVDFSFISFDFQANYNWNKMTYNRDEEAMYIFGRQNLDIGITSDKILYKVNTDTKVVFGDFLIDGITASNIGVGSTGSTPSYLGLERESGELHYNPYNGSMYVANDGELNKINSDSTFTSFGISTNNYYSITLDNFNKYFWINNEEGKLVSISEIDIIADNLDITDHGFIFTSPNDSHIYIATQNQEIKVFSTYVNQVFFTLNVDFNVDKININKSTNDIYGINLNNNQILSIDVDFIYELKAFSNIFNLSSQASASTPFDTNGSETYGSLSEDNDTSLDDYIKLKTREFIRRPRKNYMTDGAPQATWEYRWENTEDEILKELFMYDVTGDFLESTGSYSYTGTKPLPNPIIKRKPNRDLNLVDEGYAQQTIFNNLTYTLDYNDSEENISFTPVSIQTFIGFNSKTEGVINNILNIYEDEDIKFTFPSYDSFTNSEFSVTLPDQEFTFTHDSENNRGIITLSSNSTDTFNQIVDLDNLTGTSTNFNENQFLNIRVLDTTNDVGYVSSNDNINVKIIQLFERELIVEYLDDNTFTNETTAVEYPSEGTTTYLDLTLEVIKKKVAEFDIYAQTEIEDERFKNELTNIGKIINPEDIYIFKDYDINEGGIDWTFMNEKRKELLTVKNDIYNYLGAYRSIINAINYFGYNDLILYEYFQNINVDSAEFLKLFKVEVEDIFNNDIDGWTDNYKFYQFPNPNYEETKLFNLTYRITDFEGNKLITYSIEEAIIKLEGLKYWLEKNIIPLTHEIKDITGELSFLSIDQNFDTSSSIKVFETNDTMSEIDFNIEESYVMPIQNGSTVYTTIIDFLTASNDSPDYFTLGVKTYKTYDKWEAFNSYNTGDKVDYFGKIYENVLEDEGNVVLNFNNTPLEFQEVDTWDVNTLYEDSNVVKYKRRFYKYSLRTTTVNYLPWVGASGSCLVGTPDSRNGVDDNLYNDLLDLLGNEPDTPNYLRIEEDMIANNFDVLDIIRSNYPNRWCDLLDRDESLLTDISIDLLNLPETQYEGTKPANSIEARTMILNLRKDYNKTKDLYKVKEREISPQENILLENTDFILWDDVTKWAEIDLEMVQSFKEYRSGENMFLPYNFTLDSSIDPYVVVEIRAENGYGQNRTVKRSYEIRFDADDSAILETVPTV